jgi:hypothetical protein
MRTRPLLKRHDPPNVWTVPRRTLAGYEAMAMIRKGQVRNIGGNDIRAQATFIAGLFQVVA